jgi:hypothetical protein
MITMVRSFLCRSRKPNGKQGIEAQCWSRTSLVKESWAKCIMPGRDSSFSASLFLPPP